MQPPEEIPFTQGPALSPAAAVLAHLDRVGAETPPRRVRVPVALSFDEERLAIVEARLGRGNDAPRLRLDDGRLGISLLDRARDLCAKQSRCVLRLVGYWRGRSEGVGRFDVLRVDGPAADAAHESVEVESTPPEAGASAAAPGQKPADEPRERSATVTIEALRELGEFEVRFEGQEQESYTGKTRCLYFEWAYGKKLEAGWSEIDQAFHGGSGLTVLTPRGRLTARFSDLRLYLAPSFTRVFTRALAAEAPEQVRERLAEEDGPFTVEEHTLVPGQVYKARVVTESYWLPPPREGAEPRRRQARLLAVSDLPFRKGQPQRPLTPAYERISH
jgi:hypothetical protein